MKPNEPCQVIGDLLTYMYVKYVDIDHSVSPHSLIRAFTNCICLKTHFHIAFSEDLLKRQRTC